MTVSKVSLIPCEKHTPEDHQTAFFKVGCVLYIMEAEIKKLKSKDWANFFSCLVASVW